MMSQQQATHLLARKRQHRSQGTMQHRTIRRLANGSASGQTSTQCAGRCPFVGHHCFERLPVWCGRVPKEHKGGRGSQVYSCVGGTWTHGRCCWFVMPGLVWMILFHIRRLVPSSRPLPANWAKQRPRTCSDRNRFSPATVTTCLDLEVKVELRPNVQPLLDADDEDQEGDGDQASSATHRHSQRPSSHHSAARASMDQESASIPSHLTEQSSDDRDEATTILLARKERQLQKRTRGKRIYQDVVVFAAVLPFGIALLILGAIELRRGGY